MPDNSLAIARARLLAPAGLDDSGLGTLLGRVLGRAVDHADLYFQASRHESWSLEDGIVKEGTHGIEQGVGVRACAGERSGFLQRERSRCFCRAGGEQQEE